MNHQRTSVSNRYLCISLVLITSTPKSLPKYNLQDIRCRLSSWKSYFGEKKFFLYRGKYVKKKVDIVDIYNYYNTYFPLYKKYFILKNN